MHWVAILSISPNKPLLVMKYLVYIIFQLRLWGLMRDSKIRTTRGLQGRWATRCWCPHRAALAHCLAFDSEAYGESSGIERLPFAFWSTLGFIRESFRIFLVKLVVKRSCSFVYKYLILQVGLISLETGCLSRQSWLLPKDPFEDRAYFY